MSPYKALFTATENGHTVSIGLLPAMIVNEKIVVTVDLSVIWPGKTFACNIHYLFDMPAPKRQEDYAMLTDVADAIVDVVDTVDISWFSPTDWPSIVFHVERLAAGYRLSYVEPTCQCSGCMQCAAAFSQQFSALNGRVYYDQDHN